MASWRPTSSGADSCRALELHWGPFLEKFGGTPAMDPRRLRKTAQISQISSCRFSVLIPTLNPNPFFPREKKTKIFFGGLIGAAQLHALLLLVLGLASSSRCAVTDPYGAFSVKSFAVSLSVRSGQIRCAHSDRCRRSLQIQKRRALCRGVPVSDDSGELLPLPPDGRLLNSKPIWMHQAAFHTSLSSPTATCW